MDDYEDAILANGWTDRIAVKYFATFLTGTAQSWFKTTIRPIVTDRTKFKEIRELFRQNSDREQMRQKLRPEYKKWIAFAEPTGVAELQACCMKVETGMLDKRVYADEQEGDRKRSDKCDGRFNSKPKNQGQGQGKSKQGHQAGSQRDTDSTKEPRCYRCDRMGHFSSKCTATTNAKGEPIKSKQTSRNVNNVNTAADVKHPEIISINSSKNYALSHSRNILGPSNMTRGQSGAVQLVAGGGRLLEQAVKCNGVEIRAIVDTGAYVTMISDRIVKQHRWSTKGPAPRLVGAGSTNIATRGIVKLV